MSQLSRLWIIWLSMFGIYLKTESWLTLLNFMLSFINMGLLNTCCIAHLVASEQRLILYVHHCKSNANILSVLSHQLSFIMAITQFRLFKICTCLASLLSFFKRLICRWAQRNTSQKCDVQYSWHIHAVLLDEDLFYATSLCSAANMKLIDFDLLFCCITPQEWKGPQAQWWSNNSPDNSGFFIICTKTGEYSLVFHIWKDKVQIQSLD